MAYFVVIGTDNTVKTVVDEIKESHLQHNVVTSGCIVNKDNSLYYQWDIYNASGEKKQDGESNSISLRDALTNQIAQLNALLPNGSAPNVFIIGSCHTEEDVERLKFVYKSLCEIGGATLNQPSVEIVLLGYKLDNPTDVTKGPHWKTLRKFQGIENGKFFTNVLYINNVDYDDAATNVDAKLLGRFLSHWAKMVCSGGINPLHTVNSRHYAIGLAERQYNFEDLTPFFKLAAEERILDRALHDTPAPPTQEMLEKKYYKFIDLSKPWIDGICSIRDEWKDYCTHQFDYGKNAGEQPYSLSKHQQLLALYINGWLKLYCQHQRQELAQINTQINSIELELSGLQSQLPEQFVLDPDTGENIESDEYKLQKAKISSKERELERLKQKRISCENNIKQNSFADADIISNDVATGLLTENQRQKYDEHIASEKALLDYILTDRAVDVINETISLSVSEGDIPPSFPTEVIDNVGRLTPLMTSTQNLSTANSSEGTPEVPNLPQENRPGCLGLGWIKRLFHRENQTEHIAENSISDFHSDVVDDEGSEAADEKLLKEQAVSAIREFRRVKEVFTWWDELDTSVKTKEERQRQCLQEMDGVIQYEGTPQEKRVEGFVVPFHRKSISLIDMEKVRKYRDNNEYFLSQIEKLKQRYFDAATPEENRQTMQQLIKHQVIDAVRGMWHTLHWDGTNPFCNELLTDDDIHTFIEDSENGTQKQSKPFVSYAKLNTKGINQSINHLFYFSHPKIEKQPNTFRDTYHVSEGTLTPVYLENFTNSLCEVQVLDVNYYVDNLEDFMPRTEAVLNDSAIDYRQYVREIVGVVTTPKEKAKAIYDWLCNNIAYDTTLLTHDADTCWKTKRGVCQAYCELFVHLSKAVGLTADIIIGKSKEQTGKVSGEEHSWIFVYTHGYDGIFIDPTWGAGYVNDGVFTASPNDKWFGVDPDWLIFTHYANEEEWNEKASTKLSLEQFEKIPFIEPQEQAGREKLFEEFSRLLISKTDCNE